MSNFAEYIEYETYVLIKISETKKTLQNYLYMNSLLYKDESRYKTHDSSKQLQVETHKTDYYESKKVSFISR